MENSHLIIQPGIAAVILNARNEILLNLRHVGGGWAPPSGTMELGETILSALKREILKETNLEIRVERLVAVYSDPTIQIINYPDGKNVHFITTLFCCRAKKGKLKGSSEGIEWKWFATDRLPENLLPYAQVWINDALEDNLQTKVK